MDIFLNFLKLYGLVILAALSLIFQVLILFLKKRPKTLDDFIDCLHQIETLLPSLIIDVEHPGDGISKKANVIQRAEVNGIKLLGRPFSDTEHRIFISTINEQIEKILSTPQKKEI